MELSVLNVIIVMLVCAMTAFMSHMGMAVFHDGIRPVIPEYIEGRMHRGEMASIAFGLSVGFIASVGIGNALVTNLLNPWLLFLATDIIGIAAPKKWLAPIFGALWGLICLTGIGGINAVLTGMPVDLISAMGDVGTYVVTGFALFPIVAIIMQFGMKTGVITALIVLVFRFSGPKFSTISADAWTMMVGVIALVVLCILKDVRKKEKREDEDMNIFSERTARIRKNLPFLMIAGALIAVACNVHILAGSDVSMFDLSKAYAMTDSVAAQSLIKTVATNEPGTESTTQEAVSDTDSFSGEIHINSVLIVVCTAMLAFLILIAMAAIRIVSRIHLLRSSSADEVKLMKMYSYLEKLLACLGYKREPGIDYEEYILEITAQDANLKNMGLEKAVQTILAVRFGNVKCVDKADITGIINTIRQVRSYALKKARGLKKLIVCLI